MTNNDVIEQIKVIIRIREKYEYLVKVSLPIWEKKN